MSYFADNYAHGKKFDFDSTGLPFAGLKEVVEQNGIKTIPVKAVFTYEAKYGIRPALWTGHISIIIY